MCLNPIRIKNRSKYFNRATLHKVFFEVPCGKCAECLAAKRNEYYFRSYYQALDCWNHGGYCLFDTLTYNNENVPHINDFISDPDLRFAESDNFTCFNYLDIRYFFVRLRRYLSTHGFNPKEKLKYFLCSEYGEDPRYTHRPHYHVMFYVYDSSLDPVELSNAIDKCWQKGITDGAPYQGRSYVLNKRVFWRGADELHMRSVCNYIGKYMTKDSEFSKTVSKRVEVLLRRIIFKQNEVLYTRNFFKEDHFPVDLFDTKAYDLKFDFERFAKAIEENAVQKLTESNKQYIRELCRHINQFIRQSQGFGAYMIEYLGKDWIFRNGVVEMPDKETVVKQIPIPGYILNKMFKEKAIDHITGETYYRWSDYGNEFRMYHSKEALTRSVRKFKDTFGRTNLKDCFSDFQISEIENKLSTYLSGHSVYDLMYYDRYIRGRLYMDDDEPDYESFYYCDQRSLIGEDRVSSSEMFDYNSYEDFNYYVYNYEPFEQLLNLYRLVLIQTGKVKQRVYDEKKALEAHYKAIGMKLKNK